MLNLNNGDSIHGLAGTADSITYTLFGVLLNQVTRESIGQMLAQGQLAVADALLYMPPGGFEADVTMVILANVTSGAITGVKVAINGSAATAGKQIISSLTIPANGQAVWAGGVLQVFDSGGNQQVAGAANTAFDATIPAITTPLALGTAGSAATSPHRDHTHQSPGGVAAIVAASAGIVDTETKAVNASIPAGMLRVGTVLRLRAFAFITSTVNNDITFNVRLGPTTLTGNIPAALTCKPGNSGTTTAAGVLIDVTVTIRTIGASGTCYGVGVAVSHSSGAAVSQALALANELFTPASVAVDTTVANLAEICCVTAAATTAVTFQVATIEIERM